MATHLVPPTTTIVPVRVVKTVPVAITVLSPEPYVQPARPRQQRSNVLSRQFQPKIHNQTAWKQSPLPKKRSKSQLALISMGVFVFLLGVGVSVQTILVNHNTAQQVAAISKTVDNGPSTDSASDQDDSPPPSTTKPSSATIASYTVAPDSPRYIRIPKLDVFARVLRGEVKTNGSLATPNNIHDTAWFNQSAKPGEQGAALIDGHVSGWSSPGVFSGLKKLSVGDQIQIERGDGTLLNFKVVKTKSVAVDKVDMTEALNSAVPGNPGLNLITCNGKVKPGTNQFTERLLVFAVKV
jgi:LPXTG-site transpeptidase (sortase) family protein